MGLFSKKDSDDKPQGSGLDRNLPAAVFEILLFLKKATGSSRRRSMFRLQEMVRIG
jgi:hypothetical protein